MRNWEIKWCGKIARVNEKFWSSIVHTSMPSLKPAGNSLFDTQNQSGWTLENDVKMSIHRCMAV